MLLVQEGKHIFFFFCILYLHLQKIIYKNYMYMYVVSAAYLSKTKADGLGLRNWWKVVTVYWAPNTL